MTGKSKLSVWCMTRRGLTFNPAGCVSKQTPLLGHITENERLEGGLVLSCTILLEMSSWEINAIDFMVDCLYYECS